MPVVRTRAKNTDALHNKGCKSLDFHLVRNVRPEAARSRNFCKSLIGRVVRGAFEGKMMRFCVEREESHDDLLQTVTLQSSSQVLPRHKSFRSRSNIRIVTPNETVIRNDKV